jgi:hypothetical protein
MDLTSDRTERAVATDPEFHPVTWDFSTEQVELIWKETRQVFGNKLWNESMLYAVFYGTWQQEVARRSGQDFHDVLIDAVGHLGESCDPSLVFLGFQREFAKYGITTDFPPHPLHGDVLARARGLGSAMAAPAGPVTWTLTKAEFHELLAEIDAAELDDEMVAEVLDMMLDAHQVDELERRYGGELRQLLYGVVTDLPEGAGPEAVIAGIQAELAEVKITLTFQGVPNVQPERTRKDTPPQPPRD